MMPAEASVSYLLNAMNAASYSPDNNAPARAIQGSLPEGKYFMPKIAEDYFSKIQPIIIRKDSSSRRTFSDISDSLGTAPNSLHSTGNQTYSPCSGRSCNYN